MSICRDRSLNSTQHVISVSDYHPYNLVKRTPNIMQNFFISHESKMNEREWTGNNRMHMQNALRSWLAGIHRGGRGSERRAPGRRAYTVGAGRAGRRALAVRLPLLLQLRPTPMMPRPPPTRQPRRRAPAAGATGRAASAVVRAVARASSRTQSRLARAGRRALSGGCASACRSRRLPATCRPRAPNEHTHILVQ